MLKKYKMGFDIGGLLLFLAIMAPNFIWFAVPAPKDRLRADSVTEGIDTLASVCQVLMIAALCIFRNRESKKLCLNRVTAGCIVCCLAYFLCWVVYYTGIANNLVLLGLTLFPCLAFLLYALDRKNGIALVPAAGFTICHLIFTVVNFLLPA